MADRRLDTGFCEFGRYFVLFGLFYVMDLGWRANCDDWLSGPNQPIVTCYRFRPTNQPLTLENIYITLPTALHRTISEPSNVEDI